MKIKKATEEEMIAERHELARKQVIADPKDQFVNLNNAKLRLSDTERHLILDEIQFRLVNGQAQGLGAELVLEMFQSPTQEVTVDNLIHWLRIQRAGFNFLEFMAGKFSSVELLENVSDYYKIRVPKDDKTIGFLFGEIEANKNPFLIQEYGVSQTSLEQIFQQFAEQTIASDKAFKTFKLTPNGQLTKVDVIGMSLSQRRMSEMGMQGQVVPVGSAAPEGFS